MRAFVWLCLGSSEVSEPVAVLRSLYVGAWVFQIRSLTTLGSQNERSLRSHAESGREGFTS